MPCPALCTTSTGMWREVIPPIGPTVELSWQGRKRILPDAASDPASAGFAAHCSNMLAPSTAPCIGPVMSGHAIGGPACSRVMPSRSAGMQASAGLTSTRRGRAFLISAITAALAWFRFSYMMARFTSWSLHERDQALQSLVAARRGLPLLVHHPDAVGMQVLGKAAQADVDHARRRA